MDLFERARVFAAEAHKDQWYGSYPYTYHLDLVALHAYRFGFKEPMISAAVLHDVLEDTDKTYEELQNEFGYLTASLVKSVTNLPGKNRKERNLKTLPKIRTHGYYAVALKLCDRLANVEAAIMGRGNPRMLKVYQEEHEIFKMYLYKPGEHESLWRALNERIETPDKFMLPKLRANYVA